MASPTPASPAQPPPRARAATIQAATGRPRRWAASGLPPMARMSTPKRVLSSSAQYAARAARAISSPACTRVPARGGSRAASAKAADWG